MTHIGVRLDPETEAALEVLLPDNPSRGDKSDAIRQAIQAEARRQQGEIWEGEGVWEGWNFTTQHPATSWRQPVLVDPEGQAYGPGDIMEGFGRAEGHR